MLDKKHLFTDFAPISLEKWLEKVEQDLKGRSIETLNWAINKEIELPPFYHPDNATPHTLPKGLRNTTGDWEIGEDITVAVKGEAKANTQLLEALNAGVQAPCLNIGQSVDLKVVLAGVRPDYISTHFRVSKNNVNEVLNDFAQYVESLGLSTADMRGSVELTEVESSFSLLEKWRTVFPKFGLMVAHYPFYKTDPVNMLAMTLSVGNDHLGVMVEQDCPVDDAHQTIRIRLPIGKHYFVTIAMLRAFRILWANVLKAYGATITMPPIDVYFAKEVYEEDANYNMIRATTMAMSAILGGANRLTVLPSNAAEGATDFSRRIARNVQHILKMESYLDRVVDPASGSYYIEQLTHQLAAKAWKKFCMISSR